MHPVTSRRALLPAITLLLSALLLASCAQTQPPPPPFRWNDAAAAEAAFQKALSPHIPSGCAPQAGTLYPYQRAYKSTQPANEIAYHIDVSLTRSCFSRLVTALRSQLQQGTLSIGGRAPARFGDFPNADNGPALIFYFPASAQDLQDLEGSDEG